MFSTASARWVEARLRSGGRERLTLRGDSMAPTFTAGDVLEVAPLDGAPRPGEVVVAAHGGVLVAHRVLRVDGSAVWLRGDAARAADPPLPIGAVIGRVVGSRRRMGLRRIVRRLREAFRG
jgi:phage repressor protein C with HTH and peptisase S24 domain